jgi:sRNA-binding protein
MIRCAAMGRVLVVVIAMLAGCGPLVYVNDVTSGASSSVEAARVAEADKYAPYYWTRAKEYLYKARERAAAADYQGANRFGRLAKEAADLAEQSAIEAKKDPSKRPIEVDPHVAPAKSTDDAKAIAPAKDAP